MNDEKHSPGPWSADDRHICDARRNVVARAHWDINEADGSAARWEADARLIAAAPEMLALLRELADAIGQADRGEPDVEDRARALLARIDGATG